MDVHYVPEGEIPDDDLTNPMAPLHAFHMFIHGNGVIRQECIHWHHHDGYHTPCILIHNHFIHGVTIQYV